MEKTVKVHLRKLDTAWRRSRVALSGGREVESAALVDAQYPIGVSPAREGSGSCGDEVHASSEEWKSVLSKTSDMPRSWPTLNLSILGESIPQKTSDAFSSTTSSQPVAVTLSSPTHEDPPNEWMEKLLRLRTRSLSGYSEDFLSGLLCDRLRELAKGARYHRLQQDA